MTDGASIDWNRLRVRARRSTYQRVLGADLLLHLAVGLACLAAPQLVGDLADAAPGAAGWIMGWGATIILVAALYAPGLQDPFRSRFPNIIGVIGRYLLSMVWFVAGGRLIWFGVVELALAIVLGWLYFRYCIAEIMSRP